MALVCMAYFIKDIYLDVYGFRDDFADDLDLPRPKLPWLPTVYIAVDLITSNLKKLDSASITSYPDQSMVDFLVHLGGLMANETDKQQALRWLRSFFNIFEVSADIHRYWMKNLVFVVEDSKDHRRLFRKAEDGENIYLRILTSVLNVVRSLDLSDVGLLHIEQCSILPDQTTLALQGLRGSARGSGRQLRPRQGIPLHGR